MLLQEDALPFLSKENEDGNLKIPATATHLPAMQIFIDQN